MGNQDKHFQISAVGQQSQDPQRKAEVGADGTVKGLIRFNRGKLEHREAHENDWKPAVFHEELRDAQ